VAVEIVLLATLVCLGLPLGTALVAKLSEPAAPLEKIRRDNHARAIVLALGTWVVLTAVGVAFAESVDFYPTVLSDKGQDIEHAFKVLTVMAAPVAALVLTVLLYSIFRRGFEELPEDAPAFQGKGAVPLAWFGITGALTVLVMVYPGLTSLHVVNRPQQPDMVIKVEGMQWTWLVSYPDQGLSNLREIVLPVDKRVTFEITSRDVLHSFWVPAFLMKVDAVPGLTTRMTLMAETTGDFTSDPTIRLQCAELCGLSHANMSIPVTVLPKDGFDAWVKQRQNEAAGITTTAEGLQLKVVAKGIKFDVKDLSVEAGKPVTVTLDNQDAGVQHNWALYQSESAAKKNSKPIAATATKEGPGQAAVSFTLAKAGTYFFRCDVHPTTMTGTLVAR
jgi:cytochrome c oxidase subunit 2